MQENRNQTDLSSVYWPGHILYVAFKWHIVVDFCDLPGPPGKDTWSLIWPSLVFHHEKACGILALQHPLLIHCIITELSCEMMWLVYVGASPPVLFMRRAYQRELRPVPLQGKNLPLPGRETVFGSGFTLLLAQAHKQTHILHRVKSISFTVRYPGGLNRIKQNLIMTY